MNEPEERIMDMWLIIVLGVIGLLVIVSGILIAKGKGDTVKKIILPLIGLLGAGAAAGKVLGRGSQGIREENERIKEELRGVEGQRDELRETVEETTEAHEERVKDLQEQIDASDETATALKDEIEEEKEQGAQEWYEGLSDEEKQRIQDEHGLSDVPDRFRNPS